MNIFIDCSNQRIGLALFSDINDNILTKSIMTNKNMTDLLIETIFEFLEKNNLNINNDIENIYLINGPGSFTSIKLGSVFSNSFKIINENKNIYVLDSCTIQNKFNNSLSVIDAKTNLYYCKLFINNYDSVVLLINQEQIHKYASKYNLNLVNSINEYDIVSCLKHNFHKFKKVDITKPKYVKKAI